MNIKEKRRILFVVILAIAMIIDMISTFFMVGSGYREITGIILLIISISKWFLFLWVIFICGLAYLAYPLMDRANLSIHYEVICLLMAISSFMAGIGNIYMYYRYR